MNVDIAWIKQRPHFLAESLSKNFKTTVFYPYFYNRKVLSKSSTLNNCVLKRIYRAPNRIDVKLIQDFFHYVNKNRIALCIKREKPDVIFLTDPAQIEYVPKTFNGVVIYDCMDDLLAISPNLTSKNRVLKYEKKAIYKSKFVLVSSSHLKEVLVERYGKTIDRKLKLCRNAFNGNIINNINIEYNSNKMINICYFGTISNWFDFNLIKRSLERLDYIQYIIIGPIVEGVSLPESDRIKYMGVVDHDSLYKTVQEADCFVMPFIINDIILSVDPVKFYEYINFDKNIITIYYEEIKRFKDFVYFYNNIDEFVECVENLKDTKCVCKYSNDARVDFLNKNKWENRAKYIKRLIDMHI